MSERGLPGGYGLRRHGDAVIGQVESDDARRAGIPRADGGFIAAAPPYAFNWTAAYTANKLYLLALPLSTADTTVETVRIRVVLAAAGATVKVGLYAFMTDTTARMFYLIPGSESSFSAAATGLLTNTLPSPPTLIANGRYFVAFRASSAAAQFTSIPSAATGALLNTLTLAGVSGNLPSSIPYSNLSLSAVDAVPGVLYLSRLWRDIV